MNGDLSRAFVVAAFLAVILAVALLGMVIGFNLKTSSTPVSGKGQYADTALVVKDNLVLGPDNQTHDAFVPCNFTVYAGQIVNLTVFNYDDAPHSFTSPTMNLDFQIPGSQTTGVASVSKFQFTKTEAGIYRWWCTVLCDTDAGGWAMTNGSDGLPGQIGYMGGFVTVLQTS